jgi:HK97 family phage major capsid protein
MKTPVNFSLREIIESAKRGRHHQYAEAAELEEQLRRNINFGSGTFLPLNARQVDSTSGVASATLIEEIRAHSMLFRLGARSMTGVVNNPRLATETNLVQTDWVPETGQLGAPVLPTWAGEDIVPFRLHSATPLTERLFRLNGQQFEEYVFRLIMRSQAEVIDNTFIVGNGITAPLGLLNNPDIVIDDLAPDGRALTLADVLRLEGIAAQNYYESPELRYAYLMNADTKEALKQAPKVAQGDNMIMAGNSLNGHPAAVSEHMPSNLTLGTGTDLSALVFGNFRDVLALFWGGFNFVVDPYTASNTATTWIHCTSFLNFKIMKPENFAVVSGIVTV